MLKLAPENVDREDDHILLKPGGPASREISSGEASSSPVVGRMNLKCNLTVLRK